jgi:hypothetical protein
MWLDDDDDVIRPAEPSFAGHNVPDFPSLLKVGEGVSKTPHRNSSRDP